MEIQQAQQVHQQHATRLYNADAVEHAIGAMAKRIAADYAERFPLVLCVMNGGLFLTGQLMRFWEFPLTVDYVHATRYRLSTLGRDVLWKAYPQNSLKGRSVIIVDDIFDQGYTLEQVSQYCLKQGATECISAFLISKQHQRKRADIAADHSALECEDVYVYGSGMDLHSHFRNLSGIYAIPPEHSGR
jgi:hypoxanthine phosphoribosyltransferase